MKYKKYFMMLLVILLLSFFKLENVSASTKFTICRNLTELSYLRSTPGGDYVRDVDGAPVSFSGTDYIEILGTVNQGGTQYYKVFANYYSSNYTGYINSAWIKGCQEYTTDDNYGNTLRNAGFPESYILPLQKLHAIHPNWEFKVSGPIDWNNSIEGEMAQVDRNLIQSSADIKLRSTENGAYVNGQYKPFDNGNWYAASRQTVSFYMDPRNWLTEKTVFMFEQLSFDQNTQSANAVQSMLNGTFMSGSYSYNGSNKSYSDTFVQAGKEANVSAFHLVSRVVQEQGVKGQSGTINMDGGDGQRYFNFFNFGAGGSGNGAIIANALNYAKRNGWNNPYSSIVGGAAKLASEYINSNQDTIYYQKFNTINGVFYHQYQQNVRVAPGEARKNHAAYADGSILDSKLYFKIPVYKNLPAATSLSINNNGDNTLKSLSVEGCNLNPSFNSSTTSYICTVPENVNSVKVSAQTVSEFANINELGNKKLDGKETNIDVIVTAANGNQKKYTIKVIKVGSNNATPSDVISKAGLNIDGEYVSGIRMSSSRQELISNLRNTYNLTNIKYTLSNGTETSDGIVSTGDRITISVNNTSKIYKIVIKGDVNGDGKVTAIDYSRIKGYFLGKYSLSNEYFKAADVSKDNKITAIDYSRVKGYFLGKYNIEQ